MKSSLHAEFRVLITAGLAIISTLGFLWLGYMNLQPQIRHTMIFDVNQPAMSRLGPPPRVRSAEYGQEIVEGPVYFTVRAPRWFDVIQVDIEYQNSGLVLTGVGGQVGEGFAYRVAAPVVREVLADGWRRDRYVFDRVGLYTPKNQMQFLLQIDPASVSRPGGVQVRSIQATVLR